MAEQHNHNTCTIEIALLKQRAVLMEADLREMDSDIKQLRSEMQKGFDKMIERFDSLKDDLTNSRQFGKGAYWVIGLVVAAIVAFKDNLVGLVR
jgi:hypothetical protein